MFSKSCEYAIKAMICVAQESQDGKRIGIKDLAEKIDAPVHFIAKILQDLSRKGFVQSIKGPNGGFYMTAKNLKTSLADIVETIDGDKIYNECVLGLKACSHKSPCPVHHQYKEIKRNLITMLQKNTIGSFNEALASGNYFLKN